MVAIEVLWLFSNFNKFIIVLEKLCSANVTRKLLEARNAPQMHIVYKRQKM